MVVVVVVAEVVVVVVVTVSSMAVFVDEVTSEFPGLVWDATGATGSAFLDFVFFLVSDPDSKLSDTFPDPDFVFFLVSDPDSKLSNTFPHPSSLNLDASVNWYSACRAFTSTILFFKLKCYNK